MTVIACGMLIICVLILMINFAVGPFANEPFFKAHLKFKQFKPVVQHLLVFFAVIVSLIASLWIIGVFA